MPMPHGHFVNDEEGGLLKELASAVGISEGAEGLSCHLDGNLEEFT